MGKKIKAIKLLGGKCKNCGETKPWVLSFHHRDSEEKEKCINKLRKYKWSKIENEVKKCVLLCENCHREFHKNQNNNQTIYDNSKKIMLEIKCASGCEICKYNNYNGSLDFHHEENKDFDIGKIKISENSCDYINEKIIREINKCKVL